MTTLFSGIYTASLTPLTSSYEPNLPALVSHVEQLFESGSDGVAILGSTGEANSLTIEQRLDIISYCGRTLAPERLMMGTGSCALQDAIRLTQASIEAGVFSVLVIPPFYYKPQSDESVIRYYSELISSVDDSRLRIIFYNFPKLSGYNFSTEILQEFKERFGDIAAGIKDSSGNWENMLSITNNVPDFMVYSGTETLLLNILREGGAGCITASANLLAPECQLVYQAWRNDQQNTAEQVQKELNVLRKALESYQFVSELKGLMAEHTGSEHWQEMLPPFIPLLPSQVRELSEKINDLGLNLRQRIRKYFC
ncbi:MAG: dihydrodipicolinate synthase family protein [SAR324 cluster bacterium]|nr:dihydrodipicolinate synthase family protein [SAR324 cluster bacterium]MED5241703.1 dihydrodipicolinate synthase family protein [SAR324 cluster bacterium]MED5516796.1 dihydrodipicolinate synthase family protein [SAR324 cluster bacterium]MED6339961.1 dihydrodipicolinate synthase family protein [SAR324 cluster bacterium]MEE2599694.1 dihydrodipicolinate synthase family protein [SAR324 cluster bacterium]